MTLFSDLALLRSGRSLASARVFYALTGQYKRVRITSTSARFLVEVWISKWWALTLGVGHLVAWALVDHMVARQLQALRLGIVPQVRVRW